ncbi:MAG: hypothetical protein CMG52_05650, partial [Candidatus Marinimicrobia bacterium]|nr:hypothetical protein [Candidatus Neomarinimicrobiota bacterium]
MKQLIMDVLEDMSTGQINLASAAARKTVANTIVAAIKTNKKGWFLDLSSDKYGKPKLTEEELETQRYKEYWTCDICGKDTSGVDYDYIGSGTNHLGCELKSQEEIDEYVEDIDEQAYAQGRGSSHYVDNNGHYHSAPTSEEDGRDLNFLYDDDIPEGLKVAKRLSHEALEEGLREQEKREKNWLQKKHEDKVFNQAVFGDSRDLTEARIQKNK